MKSLFEKATEKSLFLTDGIEVVRTRPVSDGSFPFVTYIKTSRGEASLPTNSTILTDILMGPSRELTKSEYNSAPVLVSSNLL